MSRAILKSLLGRTLGCMPTDEELTAFLTHLRDLSVERVYIPHRQKVDVDQVLSLRHLTVRQIATETGISKSHVQRLLSRNP